MKNMQLAISVIIPTYKPDYYLLQCLSSVSKQTLDHAQYEVIIILNGTEEPYSAFIKNFINNNQEESLFKFYYIKEKGVSRARNYGLEIASGEYITFIDDDDFISPSFLEELLAKASPDTISISNELRYDDKSGTTSLESFSIEFNRKSIKGKQYYSGIRKFFSGPCMKLIYRDIIATKRFDTRFSNGEDSLFMFSISSNMLYVDFTSEKAIYYRRLRNNSAMSLERSPKVMIRNRLRMIFEFVRIYKTDPYKYSFRFLVSRILGCLHSIFNSLKNRKRHL